MPEIVRARAFANNEVAYLAWDIDGEKIPGCLGFHIVREYLDDADTITEERALAAYVAFKGQRNPDWYPQNTGVWPIQKFNWRDLTLRRRRNEAKLRPANERVRYRIRAVGKLKDGMEPVLVAEETHFDKVAKKTVPNTYEGKPLPLGYLTAPAFTNIIEVTANRPPFVSTFTNGILSTQFLVRVLNEDGKVEDNELVNHLKTPKDWLRNYLAADVIPLMHDFFAQPGGRFHAALYELEDEELIDLLKAHAARLDLILSDAGSSEKKVAGKTVTTYDARNAPARKTLHALAKTTPGFEMQDRMFSGSGHIGHNKFVVHVDDAGKARSVLTGSTNWTWSGLAGQSNNCIRIDDEAAAEAFLAYWHRLKADKQKVPKTGAKATGANQGNALKEANRAPVEATLGNGVSLEAWFSPNMPGKAQPPSKTAKTPAAPPPDMDRLFSLMRKAERAIFFCVFLPSRGGLNSIVAEAINLGLKDTSLEVIGAISDAQAMWGYEAAKETADGKKVPAWAPRTFQQDNISVVRATALTDRNIVGELGDFALKEVLTTGTAIIHDKVLVIDPHDREKCVVAFGSHNMGYKASYSNDENLVIVRGHQALAQAYAVHVLDVYDHYRFRAVEAEVSAEKGKPKTGAASARWDGFLSKSDGWQEKAGRRMSRYFAGE
ncbi:phospholipase D-like domain-containing protein [Aquabacter sp. CN5-332]|uniref:phospholipase D-like domain-containing protein n=1 Tax=Aquabacter sp. CN5-332 TaxID=3156608 RepID=UPI0032B5FDA8